MKAICLTHLKIQEMKNMIQYFHCPRTTSSEFAALGLAASGNLPTVELWDAQIENICEDILNDYMVLQESVSTGFMDSLSLGLSPAMLESVCIESETLQVS